MCKEDYERYDLIYVMDRNNLRMLNFRMPERVPITYGEGPFDISGKLWMLMSLVGDTRDVADPWYTGDFEKTYRDITFLNFPIKCTYNS
jgi:protein-tyrosine phosphatase